MIINGDGGYGLLVAYRQVGLVQRSAATWRRFCIHRVNRVNLQWLCYDDSTKNIVEVIIIIIKSQESISYRECSLLNSIEQFINRNSQTQRLTNARFTVNVGFL